ENTVEAYGSDLADFFNFLRVHLGEEPTPKALKCEIPGLKTKLIVQRLI
ncbi:hypothetical protein HOC_20593, partial [Hyphomonas oceanitis SCH89]